MADALGRGRQVDLLTAHVRAHYKGNIQDETTLKNKMCVLNTLQWVAQKVGVHLNAPTAVVAPAREHAGGGEHRERLRRLLQRHGRLPATPRRPAPVPNREELLRAPAPRLRETCAQGVLGDGSKRANGTVWRTVTCPTVLEDSRARADRKAALARQ